MHTPRDAQTVHNLLKRNLLKLNFKVQT